MANIIQVLGSSYVVTNTAAHKSQKLSTNKRPKSWVKSLRARDLSRLTEVIIPQQSSAENFVEFCSPQKIVVPTNHQSFIKLSYHQGKWLW